MRHNTIRRRAILGALASAPTWAATQTCADGDPISLLEIDKGIRSGTDITAAIDRALRVAEANRRGEVVIPGGEYVVQQITLRPRVRLRGSSRGGTRLKVASGSADPFIRMGAGPILEASLQDLTILGGSPEKATNPGQYALELRASPVSGSTPPNGGYWWSTVQNVVLNGFSKGILLEGGSIPGSYQLPNQFLSFRDVVMLLSGDSIGPALVVTGQGSQMLFQQCHFDKTGRRGEFNLVEIGRLGDYRESKGPQPSLLKFDVCTFQKTDVGVAMSGAQNISFSACWFEQLSSSIVASGNSVGVAIDACRFANAADKAAAIRFRERSEGSATNNVFAGSATRSAFEIEPGSNIYRAANMFTLGAKE